MQQSAQTSPFDDIWRSFHALPTCVMAWMSLLLGSINMAGIAFLAESKWVLIAVLAFGGIVASITTLILHRGFSRLVSGGHVVFWALLTLIPIFARPVATGAYDAFITVMLAANLFSLAFNINDLRLWLRGDRRVTGLDRSV